MVLSLCQRQNVTDVVKAGETRASERDFWSPIGLTGRLRLLEAQKAFSQCKIESFLEPVTSTFPELLQE